MNCKDCKWLEFYYPEANHKYAGLEVCGRVGIPIVKLKICPLNVVSKEVKKQDELSWTPTTSTSRETQEKQTKLYESEDIDI